MWYDFWTQQRYDGPCGITVDAPLDRLPLFVRAGAILPLGPIMQYEDERPVDELTLLVYPGPRGASRFVLYEDDGPSNTYRQGGYALTSVECISSDETTRLTIASPSGDASLIPASRSYVLRLWGDRPRRVIIEGGDELPQRADGSDATPSWWHDSERFTYVRLPASHDAVVAVIEL